VAAESLIRAALPSDLPFLRALLAAARSEGYARVSLSVEPDNPALWLYRRAGFREIGRRGGALTMAVDLAPPRRGPERA